MQEEIRKEADEMSTAEVIAREAAKAEAYKMILIAEEAGADEELIKLLKAHADSI